MIDEEIRAALEVDPSPEFVARVRTRLATEAAPPAWRWSWTFTTAATVTAAIVVAAALWRPESRAVPRPDAVQAVVPKAEAASKPQETTKTAARLGATAKPRSAKALALQATVAAGLEGSRSAAADVLLDPAETRALRQLIAGVRGEHVDLAAAQASASPTPMGLQPVDDLVIVPITIDPIAPPAGAEGVRP
jgi:hypothetical protein